MYTFIFSIAFLLLGYLIYSKFIEKLFGADSTKITPAYELQDGVDYVPMPWFKIFLIQFLNIAGLGPIVGAVLGAVYGPIAFLWIAIGNVLGGAVHDYLAGMMSVRQRGESISEIVGKYLGLNAKQFMRVFTLILMIMVGAVFIKGPANILNSMTNDYLTVNFWIWAVFIYYIAATLLPIDKLIGRIYPVFGLALLFMAVGIVYGLFFQTYTIPELTFDSFRNLNANPEKFPVFPMLFVTISCGAISGFHSTQSPLMARCIKNEKLGRRVFYGSMITEGVVAMIWAAAGMAFYGGVSELNSELIANNGNATAMVSLISNTMLGKLGGVLAILGIVAAPITTGDTAFRSARLIVADFLKYPQEKIMKRLYISIPLFAVGFLLTQINFDIIWRYMFWSNQVLATIVLWTISVYLIQLKKLYLVTFIPALFMTAVCSTYILIAPEGFQLNHQISYIIGILFTLFLALFFVAKTKIKTN
ncbi:MAG TPA: carbon starvation protein A [Bacteroidales bacterium]|nr:MAG: carbon starvation protein CstA [Bacteroidetes bacterium GWF2_33_38]OFY91338.1 MAG: carbon starvation protein CstA [Bacteroidetes bacterium RIFOXYA2_FULL_33_7]HBF88376.1 carbon starvation protein A [Bacteroidales bacterium]